MNARITGERETSNRPQSYCFVVVVGLVWFSFFGCLLLFTCLFNVLHSFSLLAHIFDAIEVDAVRPMWCTNNNSATERIDASAIVYMYSQSSLISTEGRRNERVSVARWVHEEGNKATAYAPHPFSFGYNCVSMCLSAPSLFCPSPSLHCFICATCSMHLCRLTFMCEIEFYSHVIKLTMSMFFSSSFGWKFNLLRSRFENIKWQCPFDTNSTKITTKKRNCFNYTERSYENRSDSVAKWWSASVSAVVGRCECVVQRKCE